jgi:hypothetical protein
VNYSDCKSANARPSYTTGFFLCSPCEGQREKPAYLYMETFPRRGHEHDCPYIDRILVDGAYIDRPDLDLVPEHVKAAVRAIIARENTERLLKAKPVSERIQ